MSNPNILRPFCSIAIFSFLLLCFVLPVGAQVAFTRLTEEDGLGNNSVQCILQDKSGIVWIGTNGVAMSPAIARKVIGYFTPRRVFNDPLHVNSKGEVIARSIRGEI